MRKGKFKFKSGRSLNGTSCIPMGATAELQKIPEGALGYDNTTGDLLLKRSGVLSKVGGDTPDVPEPPIPPDPTPDPDAFIVHTRQDNPEGMIVLGFLTPEDAFVEVAEIVDGGRRVLERDTDYMVETVEDVYTLVSFAEPGEFDVTVKASELNVDEVPVFLSETGTFEIISFGGIHGIYDRIFGGEVLTFEGDGIGITAIRSWAGLQNIGGFGYFGTKAFVPLEAIPNSFAPLEHMQGFGIVGAPFATGGLGGYTEFAKNKQEFFIQSCPNWEGNVAKFAKALEDAGYDAETIAAGIGPIFDGDVSAKGYFELYFPWGGLDIITVTADIIYNLYKKNGQVTVTYTEGSDYKETIPVDIIHISEEPSHDNYCVIAKARDRVMVATFGSSGSDSHFVRAIPYGFDWVNDDDILSFRLDFLLGYGLFHKFTVDDAYYTLASEGRGKAVYEATIVNSDGTITKRYRTLDTSHGTWGDIIEKVFVPEAPKDGKSYARKDGNWVEVSA